MSKKTDVLIIGSGIAGLMAALAASRKNLDVTVVSNGMGCLAISGSSIDFLGYDKDGKRLENPWAALDDLEEAHPYRLLGKDKIQDSLDSLAGIAKNRGYALECGKDANGNAVNTLMPTIMGTLKPVFLYDALQSPEALLTAKNILVLSVHGFRECRSQLVISQLRRYKFLKERDFEAKVLAAPFPEYGRSLTPLDLAHFADTAKGMEWLESKLKDLGKNHDLVLMPPILGAKSDSPIRSRIRDLLGAPFVELLSMPPGVQGMRLRHALMAELHERDVEFYENSEVKIAALKNGECTEVTSQSTAREVKFAPKAVVVATGGIIGGGVILDQGKVYEPIFDLPIPAPDDVEEWSSRDVFGKHLFSRMGVGVDQNLRPIDESGNTLINNVFFAGRTIGGYDYAHEKSGHGVAVATGWTAGNHAADHAAAKE